MPTSNPYNAPWVISVITAIKPKRILEIGIGIGAYGLLMRQYVDIVPGRLTKPEWEVQIDGIEIYESYRNPTWDYFYDQVFLSDARVIIDSIQEYDVVVMADVIEHFEKQVGLELLERLLSKAPYIIITSPHSEYPQGEMYGNIHETHLSTWSPGDFRSNPYYYVKILNCFMAVVARSQDDLARLQLKELPRLRVHKKNYLIPKAQLRKKIKKLVGPKIMSAYIALKNKG